MLELLADPNLTDRGVRLLLITDALQRSQGRATQEAIAAAASVSTKTVSRHFGKLRELGVLSSRRKGPYEWTHTIQGLGGEATVQLIPEPKQVPPREETLPIGLIRPLCVPSLRETLNKPTRIPESQTGQSRDQTPHIQINTLSLLSNKELSNKDLCLDNKEGSNYVYERTRANKDERQDMQLLDVIRSAQEKTALAREERLEKRKRRREEESDTGPCVLPSTQKRLAHEEKDPMAYTATDLNYVFKACWRKSGFKGTPFAWTLAEKAQMKKLIAEQSGKVAEEYINYVFDNWETLQKRFKINGYPSVPVINGFRRTWVAEMQNGVKDSGKKDLADTLCEHKSEADTSWGSVISALGGLK